MSITNFRTVNFGKSKTGLNTVGYKIFNTAGAVVTGRTTSGVTELSASSGIYGANIPFSSSFSGSLLWSSGEASNSEVFAVEEYNYLSVNPSVEDIKTTLTQLSGSIDGIYNVNFGRWRITNNQLILYKPDNSTVVATFNLLDSVGAATSTSPAERRRV